MITGVADPLIADLKPVAAPPLGALQLKGQQPLSGKNMLQQNAVRELKEMRDAAAYKKEQLDFVGAMRNAAE